MSQIIPRTDAIESIINTRNKFLFGSDVHVGDEFSGWEDTYGHHYYGYCRALHYDGKYLFVLYRQNGNNVTLLDGNMANYHGMLVVERGRNTYSIRDLRKRVDKYLQEHNLTEITPDVVRHAMWHKYGCLQDERVAAYNATRGVDIDA